MADTWRLQIPGGWMTVQDLRDLVGWAGSQGMAGVHAGDAQDWWGQGPISDRNPPERFVLGLQGSIQSTALGPHPSASRPWLTTGVWMDLLAQLPSPGDLDVQLVHPEGSPLVRRWGHLRLTALPRTHQWAAVVRRPGTTALAQPDPAVIDTGELPGLIAQARDAWAEGRETFWEGPSPVLDSVLPAGGREWEGFQPQGSTFSFGFCPASAWFPLEDLRSLAWLAWDSGVHRLWLTPARGLWFGGIPSRHRPAWEQWLGSRPGVHGDLDHAVRAAGSHSEAWTARREVLDHLRALDRMPPGGGVLVADEAWNRNDGVCGLPYPVLVRTRHTWLYRTGDGRRSGEGTLDEVLSALAAIPARQPETAPAPPPIQGHRCPSCQTVYDPQYGDPQRGILPGVPFEELPADWTCPVCGDPGSSYLAMVSTSPIVDLHT